MISKMILKKTSLPPIILWWFSFSAVWGIFRLFETPEIVAEMFAKPFVWIGSSILFWKLNLLPTTVFQNLKNHYFETKPFLKIYVLPLIFSVVYFLLTNFRRLSIPSIEPVHLITTISINFSTGIVEEFIYRGIMFIWLLKTTTSTKAFILVQIFFLLGHIPILLLNSDDPTSFLIRALFIVILSSIETIVFYLNKSLFSSIIMHGTWNTLVHLISL